MPDPYKIPINSPRLIAPRKRSEISPVPEGGGGEEQGPSATAPPDHIVTGPQLHWSGGEAALWWRKFGFRVIPVARGTKRSAVAWDPWLQRLSDEAIKTHWAEFADDDVAFIVGDRFLVLDTDSAEATAALDELQRQHSLSPCLTISTARGEHRYFRLAEGVVVRSDSHSGTLHPERIDVKTGRSMVNLPPSGVRTIKHRSVDHADRLSEAGQGFVDDVFRKNGRAPPRPAPERELPPVQPDDARLVKVEALLNYIDPDGGYTDWFQVLAAIFHESQGSEAGLALADAWSAKGEKYPGCRALEEKWRTLSLDVANPVTIGSLIKRAREGGADIALTLVDGFEVLSTPTEVVDPDEGAEAERTPLDRFAFPPDALDRLRAALVDRVFVLGCLALLGQSTFIFAGPGTGKTLISLFLLLKALMSGTLGKVRVYYVNLDDDLRGLVEKFPVSAEHGFKLISDSYYGFSASSLIDLLEQMARDGSAKNAVILLDTVKKVVNVMDKKEVSQFMSAVRRFVLKGGTFIGLAHTNKHLDSNGNPVPGGTSDIRDDADCTYVLREIPGGADTKEKFVEFECTKQRGPNVTKVAYAYSVDRDLSYGDLLMSVRELESEHLSATKQAAKEASEASVIEVIRTCIAEGFNTKTKLVIEVSGRTGLSRKRVGETIDRHAGNDPLQHLWRFTVGPHASHVYQLLEPEPPQPADG